jgi:hypothetical protein
MHNRLQGLDLRRPVVQNFRMDTAFSNRVRAAMGAKGLNPHRVESLTGGAWGRNVIGRMIKGQGRDIEAGPEKWKLLADLLDVSLDWLILGREGGDVARRATQAETPATPELTEQERHILWAARRMGYDLAERRLLAAEPPIQAPPVMTAEPEDRGGSGRSGGRTGGMGL